MKILIAGDFCPQYRVIDIFERGDYASVLGEVKKIIDEVDYSIVNLECPITIGGEKKIDKSGVSLSCSENGFGAIKWAGFNCVTLANNHFLDYGVNGVKNTLAVCKKYDIDVVGGGNNLQEASRILYKVINGQKLAIINCCEHEFSIATESTAGSNPLNIITQYYSIQEARSCADYVIVIVHGGVEHYQLPNPRMQETYRFFIDAGADAVINHHQHCFNGYENYHNRPIFYGLGNFCFDNEVRRTHLWCDAYMVELNFEPQKSIEYKIHPYIQCLEGPEIKLMDNNTLINFNKHLQSLCNDIKDEKLLLSKYERWVDNNSKWVLSLFETYNSRIAKSLYFRGFIPTSLKGERLNNLLNHLLCESHFDRIKNILLRIKNNGELK